MIYELELGPHTIHTSAGRVRPWASPQYKGLGYCLGLNIIKAARPSPRLNCTKDTKTFFCRPSPSVFSIRVTRVEAIVGCDDLIASVKSVLMQYVYFTIF